MKLSLSDHLVFLLFSQAGPISSCIFVQLLRCQLHQRAGINMYLGQAEAAEGWVMKNCH